MRIVPVVLAMILGATGVAGAGPGHGGKSHVMVWQGGFGKGRLGVQITEMTDELRQFFGAGAGAGVLVSRVEKDTPAAKAGVQVGDVIVSVGGTSAGDTMDVITAIGGKKKGEVVDLAVVRGKQKMTLRATLTDDPQQQQGFDAMGMGNFDVMIPQLDQLDPHMKDRLEKMEKQLREMEKKLEKLNGKQP